MDVHKQQIDRSGMFEEINSWPLQVERSWEKGYKAGQSSAEGPPRILVWAGMGGSAIGGDYCASLAADHASFPVLVHRGGPLPAWVDSSTRVLLVSFSGNTAETLETAEACVERNSAIDVLTSGGKLMQWAEEHGIHPLTIPGGRPPRTALGDSLVTTLAALAGRGWLELTEEDALTATTVLKEINALWSNPVNGSHPGNILFQILNQKLPMIYGTGVLAPIARRWANQFNENSKLPAHWGILPEMNHNEVVAYIEGTPWAKSCGVVILSDPDAPEDTRVRVDATVKLARDAGFDAAVYSPSSKGSLARSLETTVVGDWLSYHVAISHGIDPTPIPPIDTLKAAIS